MTAFEAGRERCGRHRLPMSFLFAALQIKNLEGGSHRFRRLRRIQRARESVEGARVVAAASAKSQTASPLMFRRRPCHLM